MTATELLVELFQRDVTLRPDGEHIFYTAPVGVLTPELKQEMVHHKAEMLQILTAAQDDDPPIAVKIWSNILQDDVWVVADDLSRDAWPHDAPVYTHEEVKRLQAITPQALAWVHITKAVFMATVAGVRRPPSREEAAAVCPTCGATDWREIPGGDTYCLSCARKGVDARG